MPYVCQCCYKSYEKKSWYDKHIVWCMEGETKASKIKNFSDLEEMPPIETMFIMIIDLTNKVSLLETRCNELSKYQKREKKQELQEDPQKIFAIKPQQTIYEWISQITVTENNTKNILLTTYEKEIVNIITTMIRNSEQSPLIIHNNELFVYNLIFLDI